MECRYPIMKRIRSYSIGCVGISDKLTLGIAEGYSGGLMVNDEIRLAAVKNIQSKRNNLSCDQAVDIELAVK